MDIELDFEYAIFKEENLTKIASKGFEIDAPNYSSLIFKDENDLSNYSLKVNFPARTPFLLILINPSYYYICDFYLNYNYCLYYNNSSFIKTKANLSNKNRFY